MLRSRKRPSSRNWHRRKLSRLNRAKRLPLLEGRPRLARLTLRRMPKEPLPKRVVLLLKTKMLLRL